MTQILPRPSKLPFFPPTYFLTSNKISTPKVREFEAMRALLSILLLLTGVLADKVYALDVWKDGADSLYSHMSLEEKLHQLIWLKVNTPNDLLAIDKAKLSSAGGIYLSPSITLNVSVTSLHHLDIPIAAQLDENLNPAPDHLYDLPNLVTIATITDEQLLLKYFYFLRKVGRSVGYDFMILPEIMYRSEEVLHLFDQMISFDPDYFLMKDQLSFRSARKKRDFKKIFDDKNFWVIPYSSWEEIDKGIQRYGKEMVNVHTEAHVKQSLLARMYTGELLSPSERKGLPAHLSTAIRRAAVVPLQKKNILPLQVDTLCLVTSDPYGMLATMLRKYVYVITTNQDILKSHSPILFDHLVSFDKPLNGRDLIYFGPLAGFQSHYFDAALIIPQNDENYNYLIPQLLFGVNSISGRLSEHKELLDVYSNRPVNGLGILGHVPPEVVGLDNSFRYRIEEIINEAILAGAIPGCQIALSVGGSIVLDQAYGHLTYDSLIPVDKSTLYDLASVTKVSATLLAIMDLYEQGLINLDAPISEYLPEYLHSNKASITIRELLSHQAGLRPYVPFWKNVLSADRMETFYYASAEDEKNDRRSYQLKPGPALKDSLNSWIKDSPLLNYKDTPYYTYSDIGFMILHQIVEKLVHTPLDEYLNERFYNKLKLNRVAFNPLQKSFERFEIAPTEYDYYFRDEQVWGDVHDRNAAIFGGVAGHAGLFANAHDLLVIFQMLLQDGQYGGNQLLSPVTLSAFNHRYFENNRRALGWDKKDVDVGNTSIFVSDKSFGHTGFTGTMVWVDPEFDLVFVFLANRIYPNADNYKLNQLNIRTRLQDVVYEAILSKWMN